MGVGNGAVSRTRIGPLVVPGAQGASKATLSPAGTGVLGKSEDSLPQPHLLEGNCGGRENTYVEKNVPSLGG